LKEGKSGTYFQNQTEFNSAAHTWIQFGDTDIQSSKGKNPVGLMRHNTMFNPALFQPVHGDNGLLQIIHSILQTQMEASTSLLVRASEANRARAQQYKC
jgi:hypothetical protein